MTDEKKDEKTANAEAKAEADKQQAEATKKAEADKKERETHQKDSKERAAAAQGAESVAQAVKKFADAAVQAVQVSPLAMVEGDFRASGSPGGSLEIVAHHGNKLGSSGTVTVAGKQAQTTEWSVDRIFGKTPAEAKSEDEVVVHVDDKTKFTGTLNA